MASLVALLETRSVRLLTLTGSGGTGKTRLALEVAAAVAPGFADGAAFVALAPIADADKVLPEMLAAFGLRDLDERPPLERLRAELGDRQLLLLLDEARLDLVWYGFSKGGFGQMAKEGHGV